MLVAPGTGRNQRVALRLLESIPELLRLRVRDTRRGGNRALLELGLLALHPRVGLVNCRKKLAALFDMRAVLRAAHVAAAALLILPGRQLLARRGALRVQLVELAANAGLLLLSQRRLAWPLGRRGRLIRRLAWSSTTRRLGGHRLR